MYANFIILASSSSKYDTHWKKIYNTTTELCVIYIYVCVCVCVCVCVGIYIYIYIYIYMGVELKNKVIQSKEFDMKESRRYNDSTLLPFDQ